ncbi:Aspartyl/Asparaginyl-tRNA synthetase, class IIb [Carpediemonas membranifera]|uniref:aspartate--tRNA ligase n=1 Tax=Carpediemonas membranifera TaxID=201153 RepID=A0A8J6DZZ1_9EUKA|nr:Aspartyl/Asparaginyl-tRNA synthetase, class IIb [Carpediemonas membranifera]|eukprot:KAG9391403.1 Aspartyl/Asparaginyl-tRNA synthetase, class IIb [Carpediemonas membranifera]
MSLAMVSEFAEHKYGDIVRVRARYVSKIKMGKTLMFLTFRQHGLSFQAVLDTEKKDGQSDEVFASIMNAQEVFAGKKPTPEDEAREAELRLIIKPKKVKPQKGEVIAKKTKEEKEAEKQAQAAAKVELSQMLDDRTGLKAESVVTITGVLSQPEPPKEGETPKEDDPFKVKDYEIKLQAVEMVSPVANMLPFTVADAQKRIVPAEEIKNPKKNPNVLQDTRFNNRVVDLRTQTNVAIFRVKDTMDEAFCAYNRSQNFIRIHTPKLISGASEGGAELFTLEYFKKQAALAQSPQVYKQMAIASDFRGVFEVGPVFRAENSLTNRHLTEFVGLDVEMEIKEHYHEVLEHLKRTFLHIFKATDASVDPISGARLVDIIAQTYPAEPCQYPAEPKDVPVITFVEAVDLVIKHFPEFFGETAEEQAVAAAIAKTVDFDTPLEKKVGEAVRRETGFDFYIVDQFPVSARPFYTHPSETDGYTNSFDVFLRGQEITSGAERIHEVSMLKANIDKITRMKEGFATEEIVTEHGWVEADLRAAAAAEGATEEAKKALADFEKFMADRKTATEQAVKEMFGGLTQYIAAFEMGVAPHAGAGIGLERLVMLFLGIPNCQMASMFPRTPGRLTP